MLSSEITKQGNAIEEYFCKPFAALPKHPMSEETTGYLIKLLLSKENPNISNKDKPFLLQMIEGRLRVLDFAIEDSRLILFLAIISQTPGTAVMYLTYLQYWCFENNRAELDLDSFCNIFPMGFPNEEDLHKVWRGQKVDVHGGSDNLLDYATAMQSIRFNQTPEPIL